MKIDGSFITGLAKNKLNREIVQSMHNIAHIMGKETIAEFVETEDTAKVLIDMGVDYLQGYFIGMPEITSIDLNSLPPSESRINHSASVVLNSLIPYRLISAKLI